NTTGTYNTANGQSSLGSNTTGAYNTANGASALFSNTTGSDNTANGQGALQSSSTGNNNTAIGILAGYNLASGSDNTFIGKEAGFNGSQKVDAQNSMAIGAGTYTTADNQVVIGNSAITETQLRGATLVDCTGGGTQNLRVDNNGKIVVGGGSPFTHDAVNNRVYRNDPDDEFIFGDDDTQWSSGEESRLFFDKSKRAFRVGAVSSNN